MPYRYIYMSDKHRNLCGDIIGVLRYKNGWSQEQLAGKCQLYGIDITQQAIAKIEARNRAVPDIEVVMFAKIFKVSTDYLLGLTDQP